MSPVTNAADYKDWIDLLPEKINNLPKSGDPEGGNFEQRGQSWSILKQDYHDSGNNIRLTIVAGDTAPQLQQFQGMKQFTMETEDRLVESVQISGHEAVFEMQKDRGAGTLLILVQERTLVVIEADAVAGKNELISLADDVQLSDIATQSKK